MDERHIEDLERTKKDACPAGEVEALSRVSLGLARLAVYKRVPPLVRARLDEAILLRPKGSETLEAIAERFALRERYGLGAKALETYACRIEQLVRLVVTSHLIASLFGCLPEPYRQRLAAGTQVLLLSRVVQALNARGSEALPVADLAKLASIVASVAGRTAGPGVKSKAGKKKDGHAAADANQVTPTKLAESVRALYGLDWPPEQ